MSIKFYCDNEICTHTDIGPVGFELAQEAVMDENNLTIVFCPRCGNPMKPLPSERGKRAGNYQLNNKSVREPWWASICRMLAR